MARARAFNEREIMERLRDYDSPAATASFIEKVSSYYFLFLSCAATHESYKLTVSDFAAFLMAVKFACNSQYDRASEEENRAVVPGYVASSEAALTLAVLALTNTLEGNFYTALLALNGASLSLHAAIRQGGANNVYELAKNKCHSLYAGVCSIFGGRAAVAENVNAAPDPAPGIRHC